MDIVRRLGADRIDALFNTTLVIFIIFGIISKFIYFINHSLNSDMVTPGLVSLEIWRHKNYLLSSYYLPSAYPNLFTDVLTFHLAAQVLSNFSPLGLKISSFVIYLLIVGAFSFIIYSFSNEKASSLIFAALMTNLGVYCASAGELISLPAFHNGTLLFAGICIIFYWRFLKSRGSGLPVSFILITLFADATLFSDSLIIPLFIVPLIAYYIFSGDKSPSLNLYHGIMILTFLAVLCLKTFFIRSFITYPVRPVSLQMLPQNAGIYLEGVSALILPLPWDRLGMPGYLVIILYALLLYWGAGYIMRQNSDGLRYLFVIFAISTAVLSAAYIATGLCVDIWTTRYLLFILLAILSVASLSYREKKYACILIVLVLLLPGAYSNLQFISQPHGPANQEEQELIGFLSQNGLRYGYGGFWYSNIITYLSNESIIICPMLTFNGTLDQYRHLSSGRWYGLEKNYSSYFIIHRNGESGYGFEDLPKLLNRTRPDKEITFEDYTIYVYQVGPDVRAKSLKS